MLGNILIPDIIGLIEPKAQHFLRQDPMNATTCLVITLTYRPDYRSFRVLEHTTNHSIFIKEFFRWLQR